MRFVERTVLNHPNIAQIHGLEASGPIRALVMELVAGDDLSTVIARGPMAPADALPLARQIVAALEAAHGLGIVHRDLKPVNIKVRHDLREDSGADIWTVRLDGALPRQPELFLRTALDEDLPVGVSTQQRAVGRYLRRGSLMERDSCLSATSSNLKSAS